MGNNKLKSFRQFLTEEDGMGTVEVILIIVVLVGLVIREKGNPGWLYDDISGTDGDSDHGPVSCFDRGLSVSGNLTGNRMRHGYRNG